MDESNQTAEKTQAERNAEFWQSLEKWADNMRSMSVAYSMLSGMMMGAPSMAAPMPGPMGPPPAFPMPPPMPMLFPYNFPPPMANGNPPTTASTTFPLEYVEYRVPPLWKRFAAELIDFVILFILKLAITFVAVDFFDFIDLEMIDISAEIDYKFALEVTQEILVLELIHRLVVCFYEVFALTHPAGDLPGGATPGKAIMGIRVVSCTHVLPGTTPDTVKVYPAATLSWGFAFARTLIKLIVLFCLLPICIPIFFYKFNRAGYDLICRCIVVEERVRRT